MKKYKEFIIFVLCGGMAALANLIARYVLFLFIPYQYAIILAHIIGMIVAFTLFKFFVFVRRQNYGTFREYSGFVLINMLTLLITLGVSLFFAEYFFPYIQMTWYPYDIAHIIGVSVPVISSYFGHKYITFGGKENVTE